MNHNLWSILDRLSSKDFFALPQARTYNVTYNQFKPEKQPDKTRALDQVWNFFPSFNSEWRQILTRSHFSQNLQHKDIQ